MPTDTKLKELIINELTEEQYKALTPNDDELYLTPDGSITKNENGSYVLDGDVDITGTTKLSGGLEPINRYELTDDTGAVWYLSNYGSFSSRGNALINLYDYDGNTSIYGIGYYNISNQIIRSIDILGFNTYDQCYEEVYYDGEKITIKTLAYDEDVQNKLFTHTLTLTAGTTNYILMYNCSNNATANSIQELRTLMNISSASDSVILPVVNSTDLSTAGLQVTTSLCKIGAENVTAVTDKVKVKA